MNSHTNHIEEYLKKSYQGVFTPEAIKNHIQNHIFGVEADYFIAKIKPFLNQGSKILDIGSGYGAFVCKMNKAGFKCYGIEIAEYEHNFAYDRATKIGVDNSNFYCGSALNLPFENNRFDIITLWNVLEHIEDYQTALSEAIRVLKPGGKLFIVAPNYSAFRKEAHYQVPWFPCFPKSIACLYLKLLKRNPDFLKKSIFYVTNSKVIKYLKNKNLKVSIDINEKIVLEHRFASKKVNRILKILKNLHLLNVFKKFMFLYTTNLFAKSIDIVVTK